MLKLSTDAVNASSIYMWNFNEICTLNS